MSLSTVGFFFLLNIFLSLKYCCPSVQLSNTAKLWPILENLSNTVVRFFTEKAEYAAVVNNASCNAVVNKYYYSIAFYLQNLQVLLKLYTNIYWYERRMEIYIISRKLKKKKKSYMTLLQTIG